ncbi:imidazole glycerol phosphate synthase subunit HisH [Azotosporobacter soli]|uniref:imidazole glycerol phosphate synthase subunit HisH n=1 Tax=Azotosporobacter soli TaxID=3055040 RepID=UPI0031FF28AF
MIAVIDYGMGNLYSVEKALLSLGAEVIVTSDPVVIKNAAGVILPGVGAFGDCMANLQKARLVETIQEVCRSHTPFLGICLGLQLLFEGSEEDPGVPGLGVFQGMVRKITAPNLKVPHMGWNSLRYATASYLFNKLTSDNHVYFVHSYHAVPEQRELITAWADYGSEVTAAVGKNNIQAVQFHPEKSGRVGLMILRNFVARTAGGQSGDYLSGN